MEIRWKKLVNESYTENSSQYATSYFVDSQMTNPVKKKRSLGFCCVLVLLLQWQRTILGLNHSTLIVFFSNCCRSIMLINYHPSNWTGILQRTRSVLAISDPNSWTVPLWFLGNSLNRDFGVGVWQSSFMNSTNSTKPNTKNFSFQRPRLGSGDCCREPRYTKISGLTGSRLGPSSNLLAIAFFYFCISDLLLFLLRVWN